MRIHQKIVGLAGVAVAALAVCLHAQEASSGVTLYGTSGATLSLGGTGTISGGGVFSADSSSCITWCTASDASSYLFDIVPVGGSYDILSGGTLEFNSFSSGTLILSGSSVLTTTNGGTLILGGDIFPVGGNLTVGTGTFTLTGNLTGNITLTGQTLAIDAASDKIISGVISGYGALVKSGNGTLILTGANTYVGNMTISAGVLQIGNPLALQNSVFVTTGSTGTIGLNATGAATLNLGGLSGAVDLATAITGFGGVTSLTLNLVGGAAYSGNITDGAVGMTLIKTGAGTQTLAGVNTYTGATTISAGALSIATVASLPGWSTDGSYTVAAGATLAVSNDVTDADIATMLGTKNFADGAALGFDTSTANRTYTGALGNTAQGTLGLTKLGSNTLTLLGANTYTGNTTIRAGTLQIGSGGALMMGGGAGTLNGPVHIAGGGTLVRTLLAGMTYELPPVTREGGLATTLNLLGGTARLYCAFSVSFADRISAPLASDIVRVNTPPLSVITSDTFVLQVSYDETTANALFGNESAARLGWLNPATSTWKLAVGGNAGGTAHFVGDRAYNPLTDFTLGTHGVDTANNTVWAVINHNSDFGVVSAARELWNYTSNGGAITITGYIGPDGAVTIPDTIDGLPVTGIGIGAFSNRSGVTGVTIPDSVTSIGSNAFYGCSGLTSVTIPANVTSIGSNAFYGCSGLTSVKFSGNAPSNMGYGVFSGEASGFTVYFDAGKWGFSLPDWRGYPSARLAGTTPEFSYTDTGAGITITGCSLPYGSVEIPAEINGKPVTGIGDSAFYGCSGLTGVTLPGGVMSIEGSAFCGCSGLTSVAIPNRVTTIGNFAFSSCTGLTSMTMPDSVTTIGNFAFNNCTGLTSMTIPNGVTAIGNNAFGYCIGLTRVTIPESVTSIGNGAFSDCRGLTSVTIPSSVTTIGDWTFSHCSGLTSVTIPGSVTRIGSNAFYGCSGLTSMTIPVGVTSIGSSAFLFCSGLTEVTIPNSVTSIESGAFSECNGLTSVTIPDSVITIGSNAFSGCRGLRSVAIPNSVTSLENGLLSDCSGLTSVMIPSSVTSIGDWAFSGCSRLISVSIPEGVASIGNGAFYNCSGLPGIAIPGSVTSIGDYAFSGCSSLTSITIPGSVTNIGNYAFYYCSGLTSVILSGNAPSALGYGIFSGTASGFAVYFDAGKWGFSLPTWQGYPSARLAGTAPVFSYTDTGAGLTITACSLPYGSVQIPATINGKSVMGIGNGAFYNCGGLTGITIPDGVASIGDWAFGLCASLTSVTLPDSVTSLGIYVFRSCSGLTSVNISSGLTNIPEAAFAGCTGLTGVMIPNGTTSIGKWAFDHCSSLTNLAIPVGVASIGDSAFAYCSGLTGVTIPDSVANIGSYAFYGCSGLTNLGISNQLTTIPEAAFAGCTGLTQVRIPNGVSGISAGAFFECLGLTSVTISDTVTDIGTDAFYNCASLSGVTIGSGVNRIGPRAFGFCGSLTTLTIPGSVTEIGDYAFYACGVLTNVTFLGNAPAQMGIGVFDSTASHFTVYYHNGSANFTSPMWNGYPCVNLDPPTLSAFGAWQGNRFSTDDTATGLTGMTADFDRDGMPNLLEYAFGGDPKTADAAGISPTPNVDGSNRLRIYFQCDDTRTDVTYTVQSSSDLATWTDIATSVGGAATVPINSLSTVSDTGTGLRTVSVTDQSSGNRRFLRVRVTGR